MKTQHIGAGEFKSHCLQLIDDVSHHRLSLIITKRGKALAKLVPLEEDKFSLFGCMKNSASTPGDIIGSTDEEWEADASS